MLAKPHLPALIAPNRWADASAPPACHRPIAPGGNGQTGVCIFDLANRVWDRISRAFDTYAGRFVTGNYADNADEARRARMICLFAILGAIFGAIYAAFYILIGHRWGTLIVIVCGSGFGAGSSLLRRTGSLNLVGNLLSFILVASFSSLSLVEGGMNGHAIAWLASVPLCTMLLLGRKEAGRWMAASLGVCALVASLNLFGVKLTPAYDLKWEGAVSVAGYLGFILFMFVLAVIFETGRQRAFRSLQHALAKLEVSNQEKTEFLGIAAHDLKNPLTVVIGSAELLRLIEDAGQREQLIGKIIGSSTKMLQLIKNLLDANAIEEGRFASGIERCDLQELMRECVHENGATSARKEIRLELETVAPCWAMADRPGALQVLDNLVSNALKFSPAKTTVHLSATTNGPIALLAIRDEGPGISEEDLKKMFGKFMRLSARPTGGESSNGLGLSIVKRLAERMSGTVRCDSRLGQGATFVLELPAAVD
ncbi:MAG TPA: HAMP domain-containing sensor histidine kinase [Verrucomicrobiae bacterium]